jgi:hypothetical protein
MALSDRPAERHQQVAGLFTERVRGTRSWDAPSPVAGWAARDVVRHLTGWFPGFLAWDASELTDQHCQARLVVVRAEPAGTGEGGDAVQRAPGNLGQGLGVTRAGQWCDGFPELGEGGVQLAGPLGPAEGQLGAEGEHGVVEGRVLQGEADIGPGEFS